MPFQFDRNIELDNEARLIYNKIKHEKKHEWQGLTKSEILDSLKESAQKYNPNNIFRVLLLSPLISNITRAKAEELVEHDINRISFVKLDSIIDRTDSSYAVKDKYLFQRHLSPTTPFSIDTITFYNHLLKLKNNLGYTDLYIKMGDANEVKIGQPHQENLTFYFGGISAYDFKKGFYYNSDSGNFITTGASPDNVNHHSNNFKTRKKLIFLNRQSNNTSKYPDFDECDQIGGIIHNLTTSIEFIKENFIETQLQKIYLIPGFERTPKIVSNSYCSRKGITTLIFAKYPTVHGASNQHVGPSLVPSDYGDAGTGCCP
ncbi:hypothetical protein SAMN06298216_0171 [Spirosomataceae bacterium TFI 002]|nr:hypothetical protein SAMN06298216_0171 [Spirosomataceae bacterium TFI 002]